MCWLAGREVAGNLLTGGGAEASEVGVAGATPLDEASRITGGQTVAIEAGAGIGRVRELEDISAGLEGIVASHDRGHAAIGLADAIAGHPGRGRELAGVGGEVGDG